MKKGLVLVLCTAIISGLSIYLNKYAVSGIDSSVFTFSKNLIVALALVGILLVWRRPKITARDGVTLAIIGAVGGSIPFLLYFRGLQLTTAASAGFLHKTMFIYVAVMAAISLKEKLRKEYIIAGIMLLAGNYLLLSITKTKFGTGDLMILIATLLWAAENIISKHALKHLDGTTVAAGRMGFGAIFLAAFLMATGKTQLIGQLTSSQIIWIALTSILLLGYVLTWYNGLKETDVSVATIVLLLASPITTLLQASPITLWQAAGMILVLGGVAIACKRSYASWS